VQAMWYSFWIQFQSVFYSMSKLHLLKNAYVLRCDCASCQNLLCQPSELTVPTVRTYCPTANPHCIMFQETVIFTIAVTAPHLAITSLTVLATANCGVARHDTTRLMPCSVLHISLLLSPTITTAHVTK